MNIGLLLPSAYMYERVGREKIFAPKDLFIGLANGLVKRGHTVRVYSSEDTKTLGTLVPGAIEIAIAEPPLMKIRYMQEGTRKLYARRDARWEYEIDLTARCYQEAREGKVELIHAFLEFSSHYFAESTAVPSVYTIHDPLPPKGSLDEWRYRRFPNDTYVALSQSHADELSSIIPVAGVVYNGIDVSLYPLEALLGEYLLFAGRFMPEKGVEDALETGVRTNTPTVIAGSKDYREIAYYKEKIEPRLANPLFKEVGFLAGSAKRSLLAGARALLFPIKWEEPFGMVMIEAMACGTPVIAYNRGSVSEVIRDGITGFVIDPSLGVEGLVEAVGRIGQIDRAACRRHVEENFTVEKMVEGYERVYEKVLHRK